MGFRWRRSAMLQLILVLMLGAVAPALAQDTEEVPAPDAQYVDAPPEEAPPDPAPVPAPPPAPHMWTLAEVQQRLLDLAYDPGPVDGVFGSATQSAMYAFEKVNGLPVNGSITDADIAALENPVGPAALVPDGGPDRIEVDLARQLLVLWKDNGVQLISHVSTGGGYYYCTDGQCRNAITPTGSFNVQRFVQGWETNPLGRLYNSTYIENEIGIAIHGSTSVPLYPASHGCVRIPMHIAEYFQNLVFIGENVFIV